MCTRLFPNWHLWYVYLLSFLRNATLIIFYYSLDCNFNSNCTGHGSCNSSGHCECDFHFAGDNCSQCSPHYYPIGACDTCMCEEGERMGVESNISIDCDSTSTCSGHGSCNSSGLCECDPNFAKSNCTACIADFYPADTCNICMHPIYLL